MTIPEKALIDFIHWLDETKFVPNHVKKNFLSHLDEKKHLDNTSIDFMKRVFSMAEKEQAETRSVLQSEWKTLNAATSVEEQSSQGLNHKIELYASQRMQNRVQDFKGTYQKETLVQNQQAEATALEAEIDQISAIKASLNL